MKRIYIKPRTRCPLSEDPRLAERGIELVTEPARAHWIVVSSLTSVIPLLVRFPGKRFLVYTNEPRDSRWPGSHYRAAPLLPRFEVMNVFTGDVFWHNFHFLGSYHFDRKCDLGLDLGQPIPPMTKKMLRPIQGPPVAAIFTKRRRTIARFLTGARRSAEVTRSVHALALHEAGLCDIYGAGWPPGMAIEDSSFAAAPEASVPWWTRKLQLLAGYRYNLCPENTLADYYCTEKLWHAIQAGTLPIYWGADTTIYETFPRNSFIDLADFSRPADLVKFLLELSEDDYLRRINVCREVFNLSIAERRRTIGNDLDHHVKRILLRLGD